MRSASEALVNYLTIDYLTMYSDHFYDKIFITGLKGIFNRLYYCEWILHLSVYDLSTQFKIITRFFMSKTYLIKSKLVHS